ncbi:hypothetical protein A1F99_069830 [Pyrenophora tritici-repentis]|nr:hypothetical protein A1F99_069830 [Pyrenophora tritici-repentis]
MIPWASVAAFLVLTLSLIYDLINRSAPQSSFMLPGQTCQSHFSQSIQKLASCVAARAHPTIS